MSESAENEVVFLPLSRHHLEDFFWAENVRIFRSLSWQKISFSFFANFCVKKSGFNVGLERQF